ncbi:hypothetical protein [Niabella hibiscisoli]|uniref:hypothetical protein n=1 Tax=Niabella hibiscisoli TaxID=1825928 RepID=UPI001F0D8D6E|nr:hypothetical protein [Niabella hibiscisoli]MCH5716363.1 hypothetical protein [Niabella hibiscisoli]
MFDYEEPVSAADVLVKEWVDFTGKTVSEKDANAFVMKFPAKDINTLYYHIEKNACYTARFYQPEWYVAIFPEKQKHGGIRIYLICQKSGTSCNRH